MDKHINTARSKSDGIIFYSNQNPLLGVQAVVKPDGTIKSGPIVSIVEDIFGAFGGGSLKNYVLSLDIVLIMNLLLLGFSFATTNTWIILGCIYFILFASKHFYQFIVFSYAIKFGELRSLGQFHSAEHMAVNAYNKLGRIPTLSELKKFSRFSDDCGSQQIIWDTVYNTALSLVILFVGPLNSWIYISTFIGTVLILHLARRFNLLKFLQVCFTNSPSNVELLVAIRGLIEFEQLEGNIESDCGESIVFMNLFIG